MANKRSEFDTAVDILLDRQKGATNELIRRFKNTRPFRQVPMTRDEKLAEYTNMTPDILKQRIERDGRDAANNYIAEMEKLRQVV